jgi:hypothetical protein
MMNIKQDTMSMLYITISNVVTEKKKQKINIFNKKKATHSERFFFKMIELENERNL